MASNHTPPRFFLVCAAIPLLLCACSSSAGNAPPRGPAPAVVADTCGPQSPRDISRPGGTNPLPVPEGETPNLCNVHFHKPFEHAGFDGQTPASGEPGEPVCESVDNGDRVEFHWVYTNCQLPDEPKPGLANCVCDRPDMVLRVYAEAFVVDDAGAEVAHATTGHAAYGGSTTGTDYDNAKCSPDRVNWLVNPHVSRLAKAALGDWCVENQWHEEHPHGSRELVTAPAWLSPYAP